MIELMVVMSIMAVMSTVFISILRMNQQSWEVAQSHMAVSGELRRGLDAMVRELVSSRADQVDIPADDIWYPSIAFAVPEDLDEDGSILDSNGAVEWSDEIVYSLDGQQAIREQDGEQRVLANGVQELEFRRDSTNTSVIEIRLSVQKATDTQDFPNTGEMSTRVRLRN